jgi:hypothetical protein
MKFPFLFCKNYEISLPQTCKWEVGYCLVVFSVHTQQPANE